MRRASGPRVWAPGPSKKRSAASHCGVLSGPGIVAERPSAASLRRALWGPGIVAKKAVRAQRLGGAVGPRDRRQTTSPLPPSSLHLPPPPSSFFFTLPRPSPGLSKNGVVVEGAPSAACFRRSLSGPRTVRKRPSLLPLSSSASSFSSSSFSLPLLVLPPLRPLSWTSLLPPPPPSQPPTSMDPQLSIDPPSWILDRTSILDP